MRVTLGMMTNSVMDGLMNSADRLLDAQNRATTGKRITRPSDDVPGVGRALTYRSALASIEQYERNSNIADSQLTITSSTLDSIIAQLQDVWKQAVQAGGPVINDEARSAIAVELDEITKRLADFANTQHLGKYIFAGSKSDAKPFVPTPGGVPPYTYQGDSTAFTIQIGAGVYVPTTVTGDMVFNMSSSAVPDAPDIFTTIQQIKEAVLAGNVTDLSGHIDDIKKNLNNISAIRSQVGARMQQLESMQKTLLDSKTKIQELLSNTEDADLTEAIIDLQTRQNVYQAAIATASRVLQTSLTDFLK